MIAIYAAAGTLHLAVPAPFVRIVPDWVPQPATVVAVTGVAELLGATGLLTTRWRSAAGWGLAAYALCVWPANVVHAMHDLGSGQGLGWWYHYPRLALQPAIIWWALWASGAISPPRGRPGSGSA